MRGRSIVAAVLLLVALATAPVVARDGVAVAPGPAGETGPNGEIAYSAWNDDLEYDIYTVVPGDETPTPIRLTTDGRYNADPDWSPDGTQIVYDGWADQPGPRIQVMDIDPSTDDWTVLSDPCPEDPIECYGDFQPAWSPDGTRIAFVSSRPTINNPEGWSYDILVMDAVGEMGPQVDATPLTSDAVDPEKGGGIADFQVTWSPDGTRLAFVSTGRGDDVDSCDLWVMDSRDRDGDGFGDDLQRLTFDESFNCDAFEDVTPQWSPTSNLIAFTSVRTGYFDIWLVNANDPTDLRNVTGTPERYEDQPGWSPDGTQVTFRRPIDGAYEFFSLPVPPAAGSIAAAARPRATRLTFDGKQKQQADWGVEPGSVPGTATLSVTRDGRGRVEGKKIACGRDCTSTYRLRGQVTLTADPAQGYRFKGWSGACSGKQLTCDIRLGRSKSVVAMFVPRR